TMPVCEVDLRVGGKYRYVWQNAEGRSMGMGGRFQEITRPSRIVATEVYDEYWTGGETLVTTELVETRSKTTLSTTVRYASREARDAAIKMGATKGLEASYNRLDELLATQTGGLQENPMQKITPFLWFDNNAEAAAEFYVSIFKNSKILNVSRYGD